MVNSKVIGIILGISIISIIVVFASNSDELSTSENLPVNSDQSTSIEISDSAIVFKNNSEYEVDEEGNKKYVLSVSDSPVIEN